MQEQQKTYFHKYLHKWLRDTGEPRSVLWTKLNIHESTLSKWLSATRIPSAGAIKNAIMILHDTDKERADALWYVYFGGK